MKNINSLKKYFMVLSAVFLLISAVVVDSATATLTDSTSLTVVNVTEFPFASVDITQWPGAWPSDPAASFNPEGQEVYVTNVYFSTHSMTWVTLPAATPYPPFPNGLNSMIAAVWSTDGGKTFKLGSWDYLASTSRGKAIEAGMPDCWMGTMVHSLCDRKAGECNGRNRSNVYFTEYPSQAFGCWGSAVKN